jgi:hypothetical protein
MEDETTGTQLFFQATDIIRIADEGGAKVKILTPTGDKFRTMKGPKAMETAHQFIDSINNAVKEIQAGDKSLDSPLLKFNFQHNIEENTFYLDFRKTMIKASGSPSNLIKQLKQNGKNFEVRKTSRSTLIVFDNFKYMYADSHFKNSHLNLFAQIKKEVKKNIEEKEIIVPAYQKSKYFQTNTFEPIGRGEFLKYSNCLEFDINKAYYQVLKNLGYISVLIYLKTYVWPLLEP